MKRRIAMALVSLSALLVVGFAAVTVDAKADPAGFTCQTTTGIWWGKGNTRDICDSARHPDGSWTRLREIYTPAHTIAASSSCSSGRYYSNCTYYPERFVPFASSGVDRYEVSDVPDAVNKPLWDEPGWIAP